MRRRMSRARLAATTAVVALLAAFGAAGTVPATAAPLAWSDTAVVASHLVQDQVDGITAEWGNPGPAIPDVVPTPTGPSFTLSFSETGLLGTAVWSEVASSANLAGYTFVFAGNVLTVTAPSSATPLASASVTVKVTDGHAVGFATVNEAANGSSQISLTLSDDLVQLNPASPFNNNTGGTVDFAPVPSAGVTTALGNAPAGVGLVGGVLSGTTAIPGLYKEVAVSASDAAGARAADTVEILVEGLPVFTPRPHTFGGHVISVSNNDALIGWNYGPGVHCALTRTFGYGFSDSGSPHSGFTCYNPLKSQDQPDGDVGYWTGLAAGHGYDIQIIPAGTNRQPLPDAQTGWIYIHTTK